MTSLEKKAQRLCANWINGKCLGVVFFNKNNKLHQKLDKKLHNKKCIVNKGCDYFDTVIKL